MATTCGHISPSLTLGRSLRQHCVAIFGKRCSLHLDAGAVLPLGARYPFLPDLSVETQKWSVLERRMRNFETLACLLVVAGCGSDPSPARPDAQTVPDAQSPMADASVPVDANGPLLGPGEWVIETIASTTRQVGTPALAITESGALVVAWGETGDDGTNGAIIVATSDSGAWSTETIAGGPGVAVDSNVSIASVGETVHLVWSGAETGDLSDVFYTVGTAAGDWSAPVNLTEAFESSQDRFVSAPALAVGPDGQLAVAYQSAVNLPDEIIDPAEIRVIRLADGQVMGSPVTAIDVIGDGCLFPSMIFDEPGALHLTAQCDGFLGDTYYVTNAGGAFADPVKVPDNGPNYFFSDLALDPDGETVHIAWLGFRSCDMAPECQDLLVTRVRDGEFSPLATIPGFLEFFPTITFDPVRDRLLVGFHRVYENRDGDDESDIFITRSTGQEVLAAPSNLTASSPSSRAQFPNSLQTRMDGSIYFTFMGGNIEGSPDTNEVYVAHFVPATGTE